MELLDKLPLNGYKTLISGVLLIIFGVTGYLTGNLEAFIAMGYITGGLSILGIGHKIDKVL